jgi:putative DNA modification/repair radical SAM protein
MGSLEKKINILGNASKFDICASMASPRKVTATDRIGKPDRMGICHAFAPDGRCISLFKVLMTNYCVYDCKYCMNNCGNAKEIAMFEPQELAKAFIGLYIRNYVEGLFLSSGVWRSADHTTEKIIETINLIRDKYQFRGYIHIKILPGTDKEYIRQIMEKVDRVSLNLELPSSSRLSEVSSMKNYSTDIIRCQKSIQYNIKRGLTPAGHTTQFIIGTTDESDREIVERLQWEYENVNLRRGYFSTFTPIKGTPLANKKVPLESRKRENYLYRIDWLYRRYNFKIDEIFSIMDEKEMIPLNIDPKVSIALNNEMFPLDINEASYHELLLVPGIGEISGRRIINLRKINKKISNYNDLRRVGVVVKRARPFLIINGRRETCLTEFFDKKML